MMDYFDGLVASKLFGQGSGKKEKEEVELNVTENGTYNAPDGQTYNPVNVNVSATTEKPYAKYTVNAQKQITGAKLYFDDKIPEHICDSMSELENVDLSGCASAASIGEYAFNNCGKLAIASPLPSGVTSIGEYAFHRNLALVLTELPSGITSIGKYAFDYCKFLALTELPSGITSIGESAFEGCVALALTELPSGLKEISATAFRGCTSLVSITIPNGVQRILNGAFLSCTSLTSITFPSSMNQLWTNAFAQCTSLVSVTFTDRPMTVDSRTFYGCTNLLDIYVPWAEGAVSNAPWGATNATIHYNWTEA